MKYYVQIQIQKIFETGTQQGPKIRFLTASISLCLTTTRSENANHNNHVSSDKDKLLKLHFEAFYVRKFCTKFDLWSGPPLLCRQSF